VSDATNDVQVSARVLFERVEKQLLLSSTNDDLLFYFTGHGFQVDGDLLLACSEDNVNQSPRQGYFVSHLMHQMASHGVASATVILDCCHAGLALGAEVAKNVAILGSCDAEQRSVERERSTEFTRLVLQGLDGGAADMLGNITPMALYTYVAGALGWPDGQTPVFKARMESPVVLRAVRSDVSVKHLRALAKVFTSAGDEVRLTPDFEATREQTAQALDMLRHDPDYRTRPHPLTEPKTAQQEAMDLFKVLRNAGLITIIDPTQQGKPDLYWACLNGGRVRLNPMGQYYWELASKGQLPPA
jgi:hypothetical protein